ncbi:unnamed protein product [Rangifer tarandus platyrhynchus]|uniref:Uncharacterized protein n=1 Tax=Rangifer tarandus platyrhynchus TaxID=3082113 RepID=A0AC60A931_RANTA
MHLRARVCGRTVQRVTDRGGRVPPPAPRWSIAGAACPPPDPRWASSLWKHISPASWAHTDSMAQAAWAPACRLDPGALSSLYPGPGLPAPRAFVRCSNRPRAPAWQLPKGEILPFSSMHLGTNRVNRQQISKREDGASPPQGLAGEGQHRTAGPMEPRVREPGPPAGAGGRAQALSRSGLCSWVRRAGTTPPRVPLGLAPRTPV